MVNANSRLFAVLLLLLELSLGAAESPGCSGTSCLEDAVLLQVRSRDDKTSVGLRKQAQETEHGHSEPWDDEIVPKDDLEPEEPLASKCCVCGNDDVLYSRTGTCKKCSGGIAEATDATETCQASSPKFINDGAQCTATCRDSLTSKCCVCGDNEVVYSRTGLCKKCNGGTKKTSNATEKCQRFSPGFVDDSPTCTANCKDSLASKCCLCGDNEVVYSKTGTCKKCSNGVEKTKDASKKCQVLSSKYSGDSATCTASCKDSFASKCCLCSNGDVVYSKSGSCKNCDGKPKKTYQALSKCQVLGDKYSGNSATCTASCKSLIAEKTR